MKKPNRRMSAWVLGSAAGLALVVGGGFAAQAATTAHAHPAKSVPAHPKPVPSAPGTHGSGDSNPTPVPGDENGKPYPKPVPSTSVTHGSGDSNPVPVPGDENGKPYPGTAGR
ncbi:hypothetical protein ABZ707_14745 [Streptomyces sp. NPDC006923]|uniref:hypothetical protein n=1 Tax=Streptomyces sp. NPDC006923 TaxID=3155355 RepID=UPI0033EA5B79